MALHQYLCPECGVALQSPQEVTGKSVRCLGCQAVFTARPAPTVSNVPPPPRKPEPPRRKPPAKRLEDESYQPELPPLPRNRKVPAALWVVGGAMALAVGLTIFLFVRYRDRQPEGTTPVAARTEPPTKPIPQIPVAAAKPAAVVAAGRVEEEEETATVPGKGPPAKNQPPDLSDILPKLPGLGPPNDAGETRPKDPPPAKPSGPVASRPADPSESRPEAVDPPARGDGPIPIALLGKLKAATVFIKVSAGSVHGTGSGFVLQVNGNTALIVTNDHVAHPPAKLGPAGEPQYELVFHSGRKNEFSVKAELVAGDHDHDLALLRVSGVLGYSDFPAPLNTTDKAPLAETMPIYIFGFPFGEMLATGKANPAVTIGKGTISSLREDDVGEAAFIQIDGDVNPGNSGGPVVDARGRLVGVTVAKVRNTNIGLAIPPIELHRMLGGRVGNLEFRKAREAGGKVDVDIRGTLIDPMDRVNAASLLVARADEMKDKPAVGAGGKWAALPGAEKVDLKIAGRGVSGQVKLPVRDRDRGQIEFLFQPVCVDKEGKTTYFPPVSRTLREGPDPATPVGPGGPPGGGVGPPGGIPTPKFPTPPSYGPKSPGPGPGPPPRPFGPPGPPGKAPGG